MNKKLLLGVILGIASVLTFANAESTLDKIKTSKTIIVGHRESSIPFSFYDNQQKVVGYSQDYSDKIVDKIKEKLNMPDLKVKYLAITSQNRIPLLQNGTFDFECGSTTNNVERAKQVSFSNTIFIVNTKFLVDKDSGIKDINDLKGKTVAVTSGTTSEKILNILNSKDNLNIKILALKDHSDSFRSLEAGRVAAFFIDDILLAGERAIAKDPKKWEIVGTPLSKEAYACMIRKDDTEFKQLVDEVIAKQQTSGEASKSYEKWFNQPIPPKNINLEFKLSDDMKNLFTNPNDKALD